VSTSKLSLAVMVALVSATYAFADRDTDSSSVNRSIRTEQQSNRGDLSSVNGSIDVASGSSAQDVSTVNGGIDVAADVKVRSLSTVNGNIDASGKLYVERDVESVNGSIQLYGPSTIDGTVSTVNGGIEARNAEILAKVSTVNGTIDLNATRVRGGIETVWGDMRLDATQVEGVLRVRKPSGNGWNWGGKPRRPPTLRIGANSRVANLVLEHETEVLMHPSAKIDSITGPLLGGSTRPL
jgi:DUF4097 and DUF4098 domain-containing protein YvlB